MTTQPLLQLQQITKFFPGVKALQGIDLQLEKGEILALLGENGAGKSTLMKVLCGIYQPDSGQILIEGNPHHFHNYRDAIQAGVGIIFQEFSLIPYLNAVENIFLNRELTNALGLLDRKTMEQRAQQLLQRLCVTLDLTVPIDQLSIAQQQFVEIAKALSLEARILILDEPTATLTSSEAEHLFRVMRDLKRQGVGMIFISHHLEEIFQICDTITVLRDGEYIGTHPVTATTTEQLVQMMVGRKVENTFPDRQPLEEGTERILQVEIQHHRQHPQQRFHLCKGEILGFAGLVGSGRTEMVAAMIGAQPCYHRQITLNGRRLTLRSPAHALRAGIGLLPESRKVEGLVMPFSVARNITLNRPSLLAGWLINSRQESSLVERLIERVGIKAPGAYTAVNTLSGGNQQKVVIARWLNSQCQVLIFDEPTRGIDVGAKAEIYQLMQELTDRGISIIMISSELPEIIGICDRVLVFRNGDIVSELQGPQITSQTIMLHATGNAL